MHSLARRLATAPRRPWPDRPVPVALVITGLDVGGAEKAMAGLATVDGVVVAEAEVMCKLADKETQQPIQQPENALA